MTPRPWGLLARFDRPAELVGAAERAREAGYRRLDAYSPFPIEGLSDALGLRPTRLPLLVFAGGAVGGLAGFGLQVWAMAVDYPLVVDGKPFVSWPSFVPVTFELTVLCAALTTVLGLFALSGLPRPHHPVFGADGFERASRDGFFLAIEAADPLFDANETRDLLTTLGAREVADVAE
ncbi:MAG: DUF3341 domain-containing protein [Deltaproteobacteria bacterium]|nr:DUF3341 domain-containing protein [Deltaproteobacteria bacterium]